MTPPAPKASGVSCLARFVSLVFLMLVGFALPQHAAAETVSIDDASVAENGGNAEFTVSLTQAVDSDVVLAVAYAAGTATLATDLGTRPDTVTIDEGDTEATLEVPIFNDEIVEGDEDFTVTISEGTTSLPEGVTIGTDATGTGTITDNDEAEVTLGTDTLTAAENGTFTYTVSLSKAADEAVTVRWTATDGTAMVDDDLQEQTNTVTFPANDNTAQEFTISPVDDNDEEGDETFTVTLSPDTDNPLPVGVSIPSGTDSATATIIDNDIALFLAEGERLVPEGDVAFVTVLEKRPSNSNLPVTFTWSTIEGTATRDEDFLDPPNQDYTIPAESESNGDRGQFNPHFMLISDSIVEADETFEVMFTITTPGVGFVDDRDTKPYTIVDDDHALVSLSQPASAAEGAVITFTVELDNPVAEAFSLVWTASDGTATVNDDLEDQSGTVTIDPLEKKATFSIPVSDDDEAEGSETFTVSLSGPPTGLVDIAPNRVTVSDDNNNATGTITTSDGGATVSIADETVVENVAGAAATFTVRLDQAVDSDVALDVTYAGGMTNPATPADDLGSGRPPTVTILQGQTRATIAVPITDDDIVEGDETFTVSLSGALPTGVTYGNQTATGTITDTDSAVVSIGAAEISEGGTLVFPVSLSAPVSRDITLTASTSNGTAVAGTAPLGDYTGITNGAITFPANSVADVMFEVQTTDDRIPESIRETLTVTLTGTDLPERVTLSPTASTATGTIVDNESVLVSIEDMQAAEGQDIVFPITFTMPLQLLTIVPMTVSTTSSSDSPTIDRQADLGNVPAGLGFTNFDGTLSDSTTYTVQTRDDSVVEGNETFIVTLGQPSTEEEGTTPRVDRRRAIGTIIDSDTATVSLASTATATEGDGAITFTVTLDNPVAEAFSLAWTATDGTATRATDFEAQSGTVDIPALSREVTFTIDITDDEAFEEEETFTVALSGAPTGLVHVDPDRITVSQSAATATIADDDAIFVGIADAPAVREADNASAEFTVTLSRAAAEDVVLNLEYAEVTATPATDLGADRPTTVMISEGDISAPITVPIANDALVEGEETFTVALAEDSVNAPLPRGVFIEEGADVATGTITDDDMATVSIAPAEASATEGNPVNFTVQLSQAVDEAVTVTWTASPGTGASPATLSDPGSDLGPNQDITGTAVVPANTTTAVDVAITTTSDGIVEGAETFTVTLTSATPLPDGVTFGTKTATATITDSDMATVSITPAEASVAEGGTFNFMVQLNREVDEAVTVTWTAASGTATVTGAGSDLASGQDIGGTVEFPANSAANATQTFTIATNDDDLVEGDETFTVTLGEDTEGGNDLPDGVEVGTQAATATITEDETATVSIAPAEVSEDEGDPFTFTVTLSRAAGRAVVLDVDYAPGATNPVTLADDLGSDPPDTVTIPAGDLSASFNVPIMDDDRVESDETFIVTLTAPDDLLGGVMIDDDNKSSTATITDSDEASVSLTPASLSAAEDGSFAYTANLSAPAFVPVNLIWTAVETAGRSFLRTASIPIDLKKSTGTLTIAAGSTSAPFTIQPVDDELVELDELFTVELTADGELPDRVMFASNADRSLATINDDDTDRYQIVLAPELNTSESANQTGIYNVGFHIDRGNTGDDPLVVNVVAKNGTATAGEDFRPASGQIVVPAHTSDFSGRVDFVVIDDSITEILDETFTAEFVVVSDHDVAFLNGGLLPDFPIRDDDFTSVSLSQSASAVEGEMIVFTAELDKPVSKPFELDWTANDGTATVVDDLEMQRGTVTVTALSPTATISIPVVDDDDIENEEEFTVTLTSIDGLDRLGSRDGIGRNRVTINSNVRSSTGTIIDDDMATVSIAAAVTASEGSPVAFDVNLSQAVEDAVTVRWTVAGSGAAPATVTGDDSDLAANEEITGTVTIPASKTQATVTVATVQDQLIERAETFTVRLSPDTDTPLPDDVDIHGTAHTGTGTIGNDDGAMEVRLAPASALEGEPIEFTVTLTPTIAGKLLDTDVVVSWGTNGGTATEGVDYPAGQGEFITLAPGTTTATFSVETTEDTEQEGDEIFIVALPFVNFLGFDARVRIFPDAEARTTATILDDETAELSIADGSGAEGSPVVFDVSLSAASSLPVTVRWTATTAGGDGAATLEGDGSDLASGEELTGTVVFEADDTAVKTVSLATVDDALVEGDETFTVTLSPDTDTPLPAGVTIPSGGAAATGTITETDAATVSLSPLSPSVVEGGTFTFTATLDASVSEPVTVRWTAASGTARVDGPDSDLADGQAATGTVTFQANSTASQMFTIATRDDEVAEGSETFTVDIIEDPAAPLPPGVTVGDANEAAATITEDDAAELSLSPLSPSQAEGGTFTFTIALNRASSSPVTVRWRAASGTAGVDGPDSDLADGQAATGSVIFRANSAANATRTFTIATRDDAVAEGPETFTVSIAAHPVAPLPPWITIGDDDEATATIEDDDGPVPSVLIEPRLIGAASALRRHVNRFDSVTGTVVRNRLTGSGKHNLSLDVNVVGDRRDMAVSSQPFDQGRWGAWIDGAYAGIGGNASGYQADIYGGVDYLGPDGNWLIGALIGHEAADLDIGKATYRSQYTHFGVYGGARLSEHLLFDGAATYGLATPDIALGDVSASYDANRITARGALTGDFGLAYGLWAGSVKVEPQLGLLYSRERLGAFTDSAGGVGQGETLELGRFSAGPRLTWAFDGGRLTGGARMQWDFLQLEDGVSGRVSGAADIGVTFDLAPGVTLGVQGDVDGIGIGDGFGSLGGTVELKARF